VSPEVYGAVATAIGVIAVILALLQRFGIIPPPAPKAKPKPSTPPATSLPPGHIPRSEQIPDWARDTWTRERADKEVAEAQVKADEIASRRDHSERIAALERANSNHQTELRLIGLEMGQMREATQKNSDVLGTMRDAVLILKARCPRCEDSDPAPVVRGGAARR